MPTFRRRARRLALAGALLGTPAVVLGLAASSSALSPGSPSATRTTGEGVLDGAGPMTAYVDPAHASVAAARRATYAAHHPQSAGKVSSSVSAQALDPAVYGQWNTLSYALPLRAIHVTLLHTGKFLLIAGSGNVAGDLVLKDFKAYLWDPETGELTSVPVPYDAFCAGHVVDPNGDVLVFGGTTGYKNAAHQSQGSKEVYKFHVADNTWEKMPDLLQARWYPTTVMDGVGRMFNYAGYDETGVDPLTPEVFDPATGQAQWLPKMTFPLYPSLHLLQDGRLAYTGAYYGWTHNKVKPKVFDPMTGRTTFVADPKKVIDITHRNAAMSAMVGSADNQLTWVAGGLKAVRSTYFIDFKAATPTAVAGPNLGAAKGYVSVSDLPDLTALETGGGAGYDSPVYEASILDPTSRKLTPVAPPSVRRTYHSSSVTTPDGRVVTFGGDPSGDTTFELRVEVYSPPYLFKGTRPTIDDAPEEMHYGESYDVAGTASEDTALAQAVIMRPGSATHSMDANQRVLRLGASVTETGMHITLPTNPNLAPPGYYLLFVNDAKGRPSVGRWVHLT